MPYYVLEYLQKYPTLAGKNDPNRDRLHPSPPVDRVVKLLRLVRLWACIAHAAKETTLNWSHSNTHQIMKSSLYDTTQKPIPWTRLTKKTTSRFPVLIREQHLNSSCRKKSLLNLLTENPANFPRFSRSKPKQHI